MFLMTLFILCLILTGCVLAQYNHELPARGAYPYHKVTLAAVLRARGFNAFYIAMLKEGLYSGLYGRGEYTLFVPFNSNYQNQSNTETIRNLNKNFGCYVFDKKLPSNLIRDGMSLTGINRCTVFMNKIYDRFAKKVTLWIHGVKILEEIQTDHNIVYIILSSLQIPSLSLIEYLKQSGNHHVMYSLMKKQIIHFQFPFGATFFAPLDTAFVHLPGTYVKNIFSNDTEARTFIRSHVITRPMCRQRLFSDKGWSRYINSVGRTVQLYQDMYNTQASYVNGAAVLTTTTVNDGWIYGITDTILPEINLKVLETLSALNCHTFLHNLISTNHMYPFSNILHAYTLFAPTDEAFTKLPSDVSSRLKHDKEYLMTLMRFHVVKGKHVSENFPLQTVLSSTAIHKATQQSLKLHVDGNQVTTVQDGIVLHPDNLALNGIIHIVDRVLLPPTKKVSELFRATKKLRIFLKFFRNTNETLYNSVIDGSRFYTLFAPTNRAMKVFFNQLGNQFSTDTNRRMNEILLRHIIPKPFFTTQISKSRKKRIKTLEYRNRHFTTLHIQADRKGKMFRIIEYNSNVTTPNLVATNGIIHIVNKIFSEVKL
ncbi:periostin-like [Hydractinia symbiolongicarpus]|uniref:periostin-like n=1 Tax=Hydractinia symbiolongicarpus TaxID=13093 RepID=UPI00254B516F|nr:periostin-like [Hydractinia symbiolongicarpus]